MRHPPARGISRGIGLPGLRVGSPWKLIAIKSGIPARRRRSVGPHSLVMTRLDDIPASPLFGSGVSVPRERLGPPVPDFVGLHPSPFPELERPDFYNHAPSGPGGDPLIGP